MVNVVKTNMEIEKTAGEYGKKCIACDSLFDVSKARCPDCELPLSPLSNELEEGSVIGEKYEIEGLVGDGGMGKVYKASHRLMKRQVAIKMLHSGLVSQAATLKRFKKEAEASSKLDHTNIVTTLDFGLTPDGRPYLVMDYLEGISFAELLSKEKLLKPEHCLRLFVQICAGLEHAHTKGIIHRDVKPTNIFVVEDEKKNQIIKILDFGIAKRVAKKADEELDDTKSDMTEAGTVFGSPLYMSPEQIRGTQVDYRSDVYSVSCLLYQSLTGTPLYEVEDALDCMQLHVNKKPEPFSHRCSTAGIPDSLQEIVFKGLEKDPDKRIQSMEEFGELLVGELAKLTEPQTQTSETLASTESKNVEAAPDSKDSEDSQESQEAEDSKSAKDSEQKEDGSSADSEEESIESAVETESDGNNSKVESKETQSKQESDSGKRAKSLKKWSMKAASPYAVPMLVAFILVVLSTFTDTRLFYEDGKVADKPGSTPKTTSAGSVDDELEILPSVIDAETLQKPVREALQLPFGKQEKALASDADEDDSAAKAATKLKEGKSELSLRIRQGKDAFQKEDYVAAQKSFIEANELARKLDVDSIEYLDSVTWLGKTLMARKKYKAALNYLEWSKKQIEVRYGRGSRFAREARDLLTICYKKLGMNKKA